VQRLKVQPTLKSRTIETVKKEFEPVQERGPT